MRCYFLQKGQIVAVEELTGLNDEQAVKKAHELFAKRADGLDGFEVWERARVVTRHPQNVLPFEETGSASGL